METKENLFFTKHVWAVCGTLFLTVISPNIDKAIEGTLTGKDIASLINATVVAILASSLKAIDKNVYTPKGIPGRDKECAASIIYTQPVQPSVEQQIVETVTNIAANPVTTITAQITNDPVVNQVASVIDTVSNPINVLGKSSGSSTHEQNTTGLYVKATQNTWLKGRLLAAEDLESNEKIELQPDAITYITSYKEPVDKHIEVLAGRRTWFVFSEHAQIYKNGQPIFLSTVFVPKQDTTEELTAGINLIKEFEGCHLEAYADPLTGAEPITIGWGNTCRVDGSPWFLGDSITQEEADHLLLETVNKDFLPSLQKIPTWLSMNKNQQGAILSFAWNLGAAFYNTAGFATITNALSDKKYWDSVPNALLLYINPNTNVTEGLRRRRKAEGLLWSLV